MGKLLLTDVIPEVVSLEIVDEDMAGDVLNALDIPTFVDTDTQVEYFGGSMGDYFSPP